MLAKLVLRNTPGRGEPPREVLLRGGGWEYSLIMVYGLVVPSWSYVGKGGKTESLNKATQSHQVNEVGGSHPVP